MRLPLALIAADDALLVAPAGAIAAGDFFARAAALAAELPAAPFAINLCNTRAGFMLGYAAALLRGQVSLLPPGQSRGDWEPLARRYPGAYVIDDTRADAAAIGKHARLREIPRVAPEQAAAILFTSGSTGEPSAHAKSFGQLCRGAELTAQAFGWERGKVGAIVGSVPPQHMFGLESTVMLPWRWGVPVHAGKPLLPADLEAALQDAGPGTWWMTTPLHLRAPLQADASLDNLAGVVASTMSLPAELAREAESRWNVPVLEIYGSTETGALAARRTAREESWAPLPTVQLRDESSEDEPRFRATGEHQVAGGVMLAEMLQLEADGRFRWLGRAHDLVKVAGRRASRVALDRALLEIPGIDDGAFAFGPPEDAPDESHPARRLAAFYVSATRTPAEVMAALRERIDAAFLPRPLHRVAKLPRDANGKLPRASIDALFAQCRPFRIEPTHPALPGHFPGNPIVPGVVVLARVEEALRERHADATPATLLDARFHAPLLPGVAFTIETELDAGVARFAVRLDGGAVAASGRWQMAHA